MSDHGNVDLSFTFNPFVNDPVVTLVTDILAIPQYVVPTATPLAVSVFVSSETISGTKYIIFGITVGGVIVDQQNFPLGTFSSEDLNIRIFIYDQYIAGYCNDACVYSLALYSAFYNPVIHLSLGTDTDNVALSNIVLRELPDEREAVFVDYEATTESAIQSIIQQRPIEINPEVDRGLNFTYDATKDEVPGHHVYSYENTKQDNSQISSDGIVYYEDVAVAINEDTAREIGFITRMYRLSELTTGAVEAAKKYQRSAFQRRNTKSVEMKRIDPRIEIRDVYLIDLITTGTKKHITDEIIVEDISINIQDGSYSTRINGRHNG